MKVLFCLAMTVLISSHGQQWIRITNAWSWYHFDYFMLYEKFLFNHHKWGKDQLNNYFDRKPYSGYFWLSITENKYLVVVHNNVNQLIVTIRS